MHRRALIDHLTSRFGQPIQIDRQDAFHWQVEQPGGAPSIHICLTLEDSTRRAALWVLNPLNPRSSKTEFLDIREEASLKVAIARLDEICGVEPAV